MGTLKVFVVFLKLISLLQVRKAALRKYGAIRVAADVLRLPRPVQESEVAAMSAQFLYGAVYGRPCRLCQETGKFKHLKYSKKFELKK